MKTTILEIMDDNDGEYIFHPITVFDSRSSAISAAWKRHSDFIESKGGKDFSDDECLNVHEDDFIKNINENNMVITASEDMNWRRIYRLIQIEVDLGITAL